MGASCGKNNSPFSSTFCTSVHSGGQGECTDLIDTTETPESRARPLLTPSSLMVVSVSKMASVHYLDAAESCSIVNRKWGVSMCGDGTLHDDQDSSVQSGPHLATFQWVLKEADPIGAWRSGATNSAQFILMGMRWCLSISVGAVQWQAVVALGLLEDTTGLLSEKEATFHFRLSIYNRKSPQASITIDARHAFSVGTNWSSDGVIPPITCLSPGDGFLQNGELFGDLVLLCDEKTEVGAEVEGLSSVSFAGLLDFNHRPICDRSLPHVYLISGLNIISSYPRVITFEDFLTVAECEHLLHLARPHLKRSLVSGRTISDNRTSESMFMTGPLEMDPTVQAVERRVMFYVAFLGSNVSLEREKLQVIRYKVGQEFKPHFDNEAGDCSKRAVTMLMFLTDVAEGGETYFPKGIPLISNGRKQQGLAVKPKQGRALVFWSRRPDGGEDPLSLHGGNKVLKGEKWLASKWVTLR